MAAPRAESPCKTVWRRQEATRDCGGVHKISVFCMRETWTTRFSWSLRWPGPARGPVAHKRWDDRLRRHSPIGRPVLPMRRRTPTLGPPRRSLADDVIMGRRSPPTLPSAKFQARWRPTYRRRAHPSHTGLKYSPTITRPPFVKISYIVPRTEGPSYSFQCSRAQCASSWVHGYGVQAAGRRCELASNRARKGQQVSRVRDGDT